jgi:hypothetical protein
METPNPDPLFMDGDDFYDEILNTWGNENKTFSRSWPHVLIWGQWIALSRARGFDVALNPTYRSLFIEDLSVW